MFPAFVAVCGSENSCKSEQLDRAPELVGEPPNPRGKLGVLGSNPSRPV